MSTIFFLCFRYVRARIAMYGMSETRKGCRMTKITGKITAVRSTEAVLFGDERVVKSIRTKVDLRRSSVVYEINIGGLSSVSYHSSSYKSFSPSTT
jgi:hypothetical protein